MKKAVNYLFLLLVLFGCSNKPKKDNCCNSTDASVVNKTDLAKQFSRHYIDIDVDMLKSKTKSMSEKEKKIQVGRVYSVLHFTGHISF